MTETEKAIRDFCGHHADWWPSTIQVQEMLALAQPAQEPVAWEQFYPDIGKPQLRQEPVAADLEVRRPNGPWQRYNVYSSVAVAKDAMKRIEGAPIEVRVLPLYTTPQRTWVELTEEDYVLISQLCKAKLEAAKYAAHLLKEKNNG